MSIANLTHTAILLRDLVRYNLKIIFANKFIYFLLAAFVFLVVVVAITVANDATMSSAMVYGFLVLPGMLLMFYPIVYGVQNDDDSKMLEIIFGIPNYRYKIWLTRFILVICVTFLNLLFLSILSNYTLYQIPIFEMVYELMFPTTFMASLGFMLSSRIRSGNGTAITLVIVGLIFFVFIEPLMNSEWNVFLNPFRDPRNLNQVIWESVILKNRIYLSIGSALCILYTLYNLQFREKFL
ncbi:MAG: hypothetical protein JXQ96_13515 [Cyclobacteriaceae bacterium]